MQYNDGFKARMIQRMSGPDAISANSLSKEVGVHQPTLSRWLREASTLPDMGEKHDMPKKARAAKSTRRWSAEEKLRVVRESASLRDDELGAFLRREGLHTAQLEEWRGRVDAAAKAALAATKSKKASPEAKRIRALEKDLLRKEKALAEVTALLALQKKVHLIWGDEDDDTPTKKGT